MCSSTRRRSPTRRRGGRLRRAVPALLAGRAVRRGVHRPLVTAADPGLVGRCCGSLFVALTAAFVAGGTLGVPLYIGALMVLGVNRFFLSSLSAALPHVVAADKLVMANSVRRPRARIVAFAGGLVGLGVHVATGGGQCGSAVTLLVAGAVYLLAGVVGPDHARATCSDRPGRAGRRRVLRRAGGRGRRAGGRGPARAPAPRGGRRARRHRSEPAALRDLASDVDPAVPQLLLPGGRGQRRARPLHLLVVAPRSATAPPR